MCIDNLLLVARLLMQGTLHTHAHCYVLLSLDAVAFALDAHCRVLLSLDAVAFALNAHCCVLLSLDAVQFALYAHWCVLLSLLGPLCPNHETNNALQQHTHSSSWVRA